MKKSVKTWLMAAVFLMLLGTTMVASAACSGNGNFGKLGIKKYETKTYEVNEKFYNISIYTKTADIIFEPSEDDTCKVVCSELEKVKYAVSVDEWTLNIKLVDEREWFDYIGITSGDSAIVVYLPKEEHNDLLIEASTGDITIPSDFQFVDVDISLSTGDVKSSVSASGNVKIKTSTGDILVENVISKTMDLSVSTGNVTVSKVASWDMTVGVSTGKTFLNDVSCESFVSTGSTGDISLKNVMFFDKCSIERTTGDVTFDACDGLNITVTTSTGDVTGTLLRGKNFVTKTSTGSVKVPEDSDVGTCEITTSTGDINITIKAE